jgi:hypothetical protein
VDAKVVPTEAERKAAQDKAENSERKETENIISKIFPKRAIAKIPSEFRGVSKSLDSLKPVPIIPIDVASPKGNLVWTRRRLPSSSVQGGREGTNPTGGLRLVQDDFAIEGKKIIHTNYFRNNLFGKYNWKEIRKSPFVEAAIIPFDITIYDEFKGKFELEVRHKPRGEAGQGNYTTSISWGDLGEIIKKANLAGSRLDLYSPKKKGLPFQIVISKSKV